MGQRVLRIEGLPEGALDAATAFHAEWLPRVRELLDPPRNGEVAAQSADGGSSPSGAALAASPLHNLAGGPPPSLGEDIVLIFPSAPRDHRGWRLAAVQDLACAAAPQRVNGVAGDDEGAISETVEWLAAAPGITGQLLELAPD